MNPGVFRMSLKKVTLREEKRIVINGVKLFVPSWLHLWGTQIDFQK
jgi:hypothetical protein